MGENAGMTGIFVLAVWHEHRHGILGRKEVLEMAWHFGVGEMERIKDGAAAGRRQPTTGSGGVSGGADGVKAGGGVRPGRTVGGVMKENRILVAGSSSRNIIT